MRSLASFPLLLTLLSSCLPWHARAAGRDADCRTFSSSGKESIEVGMAYEGYYVVAFTSKDQPEADRLSVFASRESPDGGSDVRQTYTRADLPVGLPRGTVGGYRFSLAGSRASSDFRVTLAVSAEGCRAGKASRSPGGEKTQLPPNYDRL